MKRTHWTRGAALALLMGCSLAQAELKPEWELGMGVGAVDFPIYRGAEERRTYVLPTPYVQYRGKFLQVERERVRGLLFRHERVELDISVNGSVPVKSKDSSARQGMPDLDPTLELGPELQVHLYYDERKHTNLDLRLPVRAVYAVNFGRFDHVGWIHHPLLNLDLRNWVPGGWDLGLQLGWLRGDRGYHAYFYDVAPQYATATRPAYSAMGGASGRQFTIGMSRRRGDVWMGFFAKYDDLRSAVFADSPLVQKREDYSVGFAIAWVFAKSEKMVETSDD